MKKPRTFLSWLMATTGVALMALGTATLLPILNADSAMAASEAQAHPTPTLVPIGGGPVVPTAKPILKPTATLVMAGNVNNKAAVASNTNTTNNTTEVNVNGHYDVAKLPIGPSPSFVIPAIPDGISIPAIKVNAKIQSVGPGRRVGAAGVEWSAPPNKNVGWHDYSGKLGESKNIVLNGHNNIFGSVFKKLYTLVPGDQIVLTAQGQSRIYEVQEVHKLLEKGQPYEVRVKNAEYILPKNEDILTVISCWPENNNTHRIVVVAKPVN